MKKIYTEERKKRMARSIKNIIFDMGNVLLTYDPEVCLNHFLDKEDDRAIIRRELFEGPEWEQGDLGHLTDLERFYKVRGRVPDRLHDALRSCAVHWTMCMRPVPGMRELCDREKKEGRRLYVLSNASSSFYDYFPRFAAFSYFDGIVVSCDIHMIKPGAGIYKYLLEKYQLLPEECFFLDDREENVEAARKAGLEAAVFTGDIAAVKRCISGEDLS